MPRHTNYLKLRREAGCITADQAGRPAIRAKNEPSRTCPYWCQDHETGEWSECGKPKKIDHGDWSNRTVMLGYCREHMALTTPLQNSSKLF